MMRMRVGAMASVLFTMCGLCVDTQADAQRASQDRIAAFEAASIKRRDPGGPTVPMLMNVTPGRIHFQAVTLKDCIRWAYSLADYQVSGGPPWVATIIYSLPKRRLQLLHRESIAADHLQQVSTIG